MKRAAFIFLVSIAVMTLLEGCYHAPPSGAVGPAYYEEPAGTVAPAPYDPPPPGAVGPARRR
jgi:hypothetical protein